MEQNKATRPPVKVLSGVMRSVATRGFLDFIDIACVITCIWTVLCLIYFNFVKDFVEILVFASLKYINRFRWLCRLLRLDNFLRRIVVLLETYELCYSQNTDNLQPEETFKKSAEMNVSISNSVKVQFPSCAPECTPCGFNNKPQINPRYIDFAEGPSAGANFKMTNLNLEEKAAWVSEKCVLSSPEKHSSSSSEKHILSSPEKHTVSSSGKHTVSSSGKHTVSSSGKHTVSSPEENIDFNAEEVLDSNENMIFNPKSEIMLRLKDDCESDAVFLSPEQESGLKRKYFDWNFTKIRDSFLKESRSKMLSVFSFKIKRENLPTGVIQVQPTRVGDKEKLIIPSDSPVNSGCCNSLFVSFKSKLEMKENVPMSMHYKRF